MSSFKRSASRDIVVLDLSSLLCKVGFGGEGSPRFILRLGLPRAKPGTEKVADGEFTYEHDIELLLREIFLKKLMCSPRDRKVVICESIVEPSKTRLTLVKVLLERLKVASVLLMPAPVLSVYAGGTEDDLSALVVQVGYSESTVLPVCSRLPLLHALQTAQHGTRTVHNCILHLAKEGTLIKWPDSSGFVAQRQLHSRALSKFGSGLTEDLDDVMLRLCFVQSKAQQQQEAAAAAEETSSSSTQDGSMLVGSGAEVWLAADARRGVCDVLFGAGLSTYGGDPELSLARLLLDALLACALDVRPQVAKRVVLAGGGVMLRGFQARLIEECQSLCNAEKRYKELLPLVTNVLAIKPSPFQPNTLPWVGASVFAAASKLEGSLTLAGLKAGQTPPDPFLASPPAAALFAPPLPCGVDLSWPPSARKTTQT